MKNDGKIRLIRWPASRGEMTLGNLMAVFDQLPHGAELGDVLSIDGSTFLMCRAESFKVLPLDCYIDEMIIPVDVTLNVCHKN